MGNNLFESNPTIKGPSIPLSPLEQKYFSKVNSILHNNYTENLYSDSNLEISLQKKSFLESQVFEEELVDIAWLDYIYEHLEKVKKNKNMTWVDELEELLLKETFFYQNKYLSDFFYREYNLKTFPKVLNDDPNNIFYEETNTNNINDKQGNIKSNNDANNSMVNKSSSYNELDVTDNLGGSYMEIKIDNLAPNDPTIKYVMDRNLVKAYIRIFKRHIYNDKKHPINKIISLFNKTFCKFIRTNIENFNEKQKNQDLMDENYEKQLKKFEAQITNCLQEFILTMNCSLKLFYSTCINFSFFKEEKDDLINLVTSLFFKTGKLYETLFDLYSLAYRQEFQILQEKLIDLQNIKPKILEITDKYCLDETALELQSKIIKEKQKEKEENEKDKNDSKDINTLPEIKEKEELKENDDDNNINNLQLEINNSNIINITNDNQFEPNTYDIKNKNNIISTKEENNNDKDGNKSDDDDYLLSKFKEEDLSIDPKNDGENYIRKTISNFNSKTYLFPQIRNKIRDTLAQNEQYILEAKKSGNLPMPYFSAINLLKKIRSFKTPFEKIIILAAINDQITESVMTFWSKMTKYIKSSFLFIESDELKAIFLYIFIKTQMPELLIECKIITNFTTQQTRGFNISYNLSMAEASIEKIMEMKNTKEMDTAEKELKEVKKTFGVLANQRFSRLSRASAPENPFS